MGLMCHAERQENLVGLWKGYELEREIIRFGKLNLTVLENGSE